ncbi:MAG: small multidrug resistance family-3 protein [Cellvibrionaceae bacterium]|jgi:small multidrug resistance family-3 protein
MTFLRTAGIFLLAGLAEISGGWLIWQWLRVGKPMVWGISGALILVVYGVIPTLQQEESFGRVYAAYGGIFVVLSLAWAWYFDGWIPDRFDLLGGAIVLAGVSVIMWGRGF